MTHTTTDFEAQEETASAGWREVSAALHERAEASPSAEAWGKIRARIAAAPAQLSGWFSWALGAALTLTALSLLWLAVRPGVALRWTVSGETPAAFRIYRAEAGSSDYRWIDEIPADSHHREYEYSDAFLFPGKAYSYRVEAVGRGGVIAVSRSVA
ncbi:MAG: hypothetical protein L0Z70_14170, partial [Chloroflexi bacterium]|nr:hypothetical protein [Chloroflexota bacterium]